MTEADSPSVTADQMRDVDRAMIEDFHIELMQMMQNAGRGLAEVAVDLFRPRRVLVLAGPGGNGGGGLVAARHLSNRGVMVRVVIAAPADRLGVVPRHQLDILNWMGTFVVPAPVVDLEPTLRVHADVDLVIDALLGYSLAGDPREPVATLIRWINEQVGRLYLADISVPPALYRRMGIEVGDLFADSPIVPISTR
jgi:NAD(P)H-hydrate epimerase